MQTKTLSEYAMRVIHEYCHLPFSAVSVPCPYFNNRRIKMRGALRVLIGKGTPQEIVDEAHIIALKEHLPIDEYNADTLRQFLTDHQLGVDCSGLVYHVLNAEHRGRLKKMLSFPHAKNPIRTLLTHLRPAENTGVKTFSHDANSRVVAIKDANPGDMIVFLETGKFATPDHMLVIHTVEYENTVPVMLHYTHALPWSTDGKNNTHVRQGIIHIINPENPLSEQEWREEEKTGEENETFQLGRSAKRLEMRKLNCWSCV
ncbi:MAG TPA: hypothetical protein DCY48_04185 [Candidatus Magasanikbacteria bacterium]|nr:MAG: hypothetical protein A3I74_00260 [Candidatus Magasanikbacteria bacterium RIFCSPLOWO2_02_FULL_47_16]OGH80114.1 MAG: hypothetical protein A3C10_02970 [Candidatus Magasanikbacteria bacterium RIFCSPHIGHO2_02_FULL_48_18]OGH83193.1 MAG: hypothetical protein A3G08_02685 [Candidatus Magasanikbacteria bacterium RIFCSPLOWO2_12_FULL_47_9b]HAZ28944.1 hypothetical protein [Candidatus Magasanikbacteria bacterium]